MRKFSPALLLLLIVLLLAGSGGTIYGAAKGGAHKSEPAAKVPLTQAQTSGKYPENEGIRPPPF